MRARPCSRTATDTDPGSWLTNVSRGSYATAYKHDPFFGIWGVDFRSSGTVRMARTTVFSMGLPSRIHVGLPGTTKTMRFTNHFNSALQLKRTSVSEGAFSDGAYWTNSY